MPVARPAAVALGPPVGQAAEVRCNYPGQRVELSGPSGLRALADGERVVQVVANLIDNAAKYSPEGAVAAIRVRSGHVGTELGLYLGRRLVMAMGGEPDLESGGPAGSTFWLRLPALGEDAAGPRVRSPE